MDVDTGIPAIGHVPWGSHFCHFFRSGDDLAETLVPFFKTGLEGGEACLWVTATPFSREQAWSALNTHVDSLDRRLARGQIEIVGHKEWYERYGERSRADVAQVWIEAKTRAVERGYLGLRLTGNTAFLRPQEWDDFMDYEAVLRNVFRGHELLALCSYDSERCDADAVLDVVQAHDFALARRRGIWEVVESASGRQSREALIALNAELEQRIAARTQDLTDALAHQRLLTAELSHRVKNTIASVQSLVEQTLRTQAGIDQARAAIRGRLAAFSQVHDALAAVDWHGVRMRDVLSAVLRPYADKVSLELSDAALAPRAALDLSLVFHELGTNAAKYGALTAASGRVAVRAEVTGDEPCVVITWRESGGPAVERPAREGFGTRLIRWLVAHDLRGECEMAFERSGLTCTIRAPARELLARNVGCAHAGYH